MIEKIRENITNILIQNKFFRRRHTFQVEGVIVLELLAVEDSPDLLRSDIIFVWAMLDPKKIIKLFFLRQSLLVELDWVIHPVVGVDALLAEEIVFLRRLEAVLRSRIEVGEKITEFGASLFLLGVFEILDKALEGGIEEKFRVFELEVLAELEKHVFLNALGDDLDFGALVKSYPPNQEMGIVSPEVMEEDGDFVEFSKHQIASLMRRSAEFTSEVVVIPHFLAAVGVGEWLLADVALLCLVVSAPIGNIEGKHPLFAEEKFEDAGFFLDHFFEEPLSRVCSVVDNDVGAPEILVICISDAGNYFVGYTDGHLFLIIDCGSWCSLIDGVCCAFEVRVNDYGTILLETDILEYKSGSWFGENVDLITEIGPWTELLMMFEGLFAIWVAETAFTEMMFVAGFADIREKATEGADVGVVAFPI